MNLTLGKKILCFRLDDGKKIRKKQLPILEDSPCCPPEPPKLYCPPLPPLIKRPIKPPVQCTPFDDTCNIDPPRLDDLCCVKPTVHELPAFRPKYYPRKKHTECPEDPYSTDICCIPNILRKPKRSKKGKYCKC